MASGAPLIIQLPASADILFRTYASILKGPGIPSGVSSILSRMINNGISLYSQTVKDSLLKLRDATPAIINKLLSDFIEAYKVEYIYISLTTLLYTTNVANVALNAGATREEALSISRTIVTLKANRIIDNTLIRSSIITNLVYDLDIAEEDATRITDVFLNSYIEKTIRPDTSKAMGIKTTVTARVIDYGGPTEDVTTFNGVYFVKLLLKYGVQYSFSEVVTLPPTRPIRPTLRSTNIEEEVMIETPNAASLITIGAAGYVEEYAPPIPSIEAGAVVLAQKSNNSDTVSSLASAMNKRASTSTKDATEVKETIEIVAAATGGGAVGSGSGSGSSGVAISAGEDAETGNIKKVLFVLQAAGSPPIDLPRVRPGETLEITSGVTVRYGDTVVSDSLTEDGERVLLFNSVAVADGSLLPGTQIQVRLGSLLFIAPPANSFPARINPLRALQTLFVYTRSSIEALAAGGPLPASNRVSWAPAGLAAGALLRDLGRSIVVADKRTGTHQYVFRNVQWINGGVTEGVSGSPADVDAWQTGWVCTWAADGIPLAAF